MAAAAEVLLIFKAMGLGEVEAARVALGGIQGSTSLAQRGMKDMNAEAGFLSGAMTALETGAAAAGLAIAGIGAVSIKGASDYQKTTEILHTQANVNQKDVEELRKRFLEMGPLLGTGPTSLADGFYHIASAATQFPPALRNITSELDIYTNAVKLAKIGNSDLNDTTQAVVAVMAAFGKQGMTAADAAAQLNAIVGAGDMRMSQLAVAMGTGIVPVAATFGLQLKDVGAALATLTDNVTPADQAATRLRMTLSLLGSPSGVAAKALASVGISAEEAGGILASRQQFYDQFGIHLSQIALDLRQPNGLLVALSDIKTHMDDAMQSLPTDEKAAEQSAILSKAFGGARSAAGLLTLMDEFDSFKAKYGAIAAGAANFEDAWASTIDTVSFKWDSFRAALEATGISIGNVLLPYVSQLLDKLTPLAYAVGDWAGKALPQAIDWIKKFGDELKTAADRAGDLAAKFATGALKDIFGVTPGQAGKALGGILGPIGGALGAAGGDIAGAIRIWSTPSASVPLAPTLPGGAANMANQSAGLVPTDTQRMAAIAAIMSGAVTMPGGAANAANQAIGHLGEFHAAPGGAANAANQAAGRVAPHHAAGPPPGTDLVHAWDAIKAAATAFWGWIHPYIQSVLAGIRGAIGDFIKGVGAWWKAHGDEVMQIWNGIVDDVKLALAILIPVVQIAFTFVWESIKGAFIVILDVLRGAWDLIVTIFTVALDLVTGHWDRAWKDLKDGLGQVMSDIGTIIHDAWEGIVKTLEATGHRILDAISDPLKGLGHAIVKGIEDNVPGGMDGPIGKALKSIPGFELGGLVPGPMGAPMLAMVHGGETIIPAGGVRSASSFSSSSSRSDDVCAKLDQVIALLSGSTSNHMTVQIGDETIQKMVSRTSTAALVGAMSR